MKTDVHPIYYPAATVTRVCGNVFTVGSTKEAISVEICSNCHPFFTGTEKIVDTAGRVERFRTRAAQAGTKKPKAEKVSKKPAAPIKATLATRKVKPKASKKEK